jgi:16S rRNA G966 N2-methylase RsmD
MPASPAPVPLVVADPPYADDQALPRVLALLGAPGVVEPEGLVVCKHHWRWEGPPAVGLLALERSKRFGETALTWYRAALG